MTTSKSTDAPLRICEPCSTKAGFPVSHEGRQLVHNAYEMFLTRIAKYDDPYNEEWDWDDVSDKWERHAFSAFRDLLAMSTPSAPTGADQECPGCVAAHSGSAMHNDKHDARCRGANLRDENQTAYNAAEIAALSKELIGPVEYERLAKTPWARSLVHSLIQRIANLRFNVKQLLPALAGQDDESPCPDPRCNDTLGAMPMPQCVTAVAWAEEADKLRQQVDELAGQGEAAWNDALAYVASKHAMHDQLGNGAICKVLREMYNYFATRATNPPSPAPDALSLDEIEQFRHMAESWKDMPTWARDLFERAYAQLRNSPAPDKGEAIKRAAEKIDQHCAVPLIREAGDPEEIAAIASIIEGELGELPQEDAQ